MYSRTASAFGLHARIACIARIERSEATTMPRPAEFDADEVVRQVMEVFWTHGYNATSIQDLVESTGVLRGSLYHTFSDKHTLYLQALARYGDIALRRATDLLNQPDSPHDRVRRLFMDVVEVPEENRRRGSMICNATTEMVPQDAEVAQVIERISAQLKGLIQTTLEHAQGEGTLDCRKNPAALTVYLVSSLQGLCVTAQGGASRAELEDIVEMTLSILS